MSRLLQPYRTIRTMLAVIAAASPALVTQLASAQMITPPTATPSAPASTAVGQPAPGIATSPTPMVPIGAATSSAPTGEARVAPVKRVAPKTPALPTIVARAIAKARQFKVAAKPRPAAGTSLVPPMALGAKTTAASVTCNPGETFVRRVGSCQKRAGAVAKSRSVTAKPAKAAKARAVATRAKPRPKA